MLNSEESPSLFQKPLGVQFMNELEAMLTDLKDGNELWEIMTLNTLGKHKSTVYASFKLKKDVPLREKKFEVLHDLNILLSKHLEKKFWFKNTIRVNITDSSHSILIWYHPLRKKDVTILQYQGVLNYSYVEMVAYNRDLQDELKRTNWYEFVYDLNTPGFKSSYREFTLSTFSFRNIYWKDEYFPHKRSKFIRIPSIGALRELFYDISENREVRRAFLKWLKIHEITEINSAHDSIIALFLKFYMEHRFKKKWNIEDKWEYISEEFVINDYLTLRFEHNRATNIYVDGKLFHQCKYLLLHVPITNVSDYDEIESIDEAAEKLSRSLEGHTSEIPAKTEFWGHCSNLQAWAESDYDTRLLHRNLAFPLLKKLTKAGDPKARRVFKEEIARRFESGHDTVISFLMKENYLVFLSKEETEIIFINILRKGNVPLIRRLIGNYSFRRFSINDETLGSPESKLYKNIEHLLESQKNPPTAINFLKELFEAGYKDLARQIFSEIFKKMLKEERVLKVFNMIHMDYLFECLSPELLKLLTIKMLETGNLETISFLLEKKFITFHLTREDLSALEVKPSSSLYKHPLLFKIIKHFFEFENLKIYSGRKKRLKIELCKNTSQKRYTLYFYEKGYYYSSYYPNGNYPQINIQEETDFKRIAYHSNYLNYFHFPKLKLDGRIPLIHHLIHDFITVILSKDVSVFIKEKSKNLPLQISLEIRYLNEKTGEECIFGPEILLTEFLSTSEKAVFKKRTSRRELYLKESQHKRITDFFISDKKDEKGREILISSTKNKKPDKIE